VLVCDEAQGLIDPFKKRSQGVKGSGAKWQGGRAWGPQAWHLIANSQVSIFFMDGEQGYRQIETTHPQDIHDLVTAERARGEQIELLHLHLGSAQFRLNGLSSLCEWIDVLLGLRDSKSARAASVPPVELEEAKRVREAFRVLDDPAELRNRLVHLARQASGSTRLLATYAWDWASKSDASRVDSEDGKILSGRPSIPGLRFRWLPDDNDAKADFLLGRGVYGTPDGLFGSGVAPVAVAAYPLTVRGQEFAHVGVLWGRHLVLRQDGIRVDPHLCPGTDYEMVAGRAKNGDREANEELRRMVAQALRILLTRGTETVQIWIEDEETHRLVNESFNQTFPT
jgi:hypothetical protein